MITIRSNSTDPTNLAERQHSGVLFPRLRVLASSRCQGEKSTRPQVEHSLMNPTFKSTGHPGAALMTSALSIPAPQGQLHGYGDEGEQGADAIAFGGLSDISGASEMGRLVVPEPPKQVVRGEVTGVGTLDIGPSLLSSAMVGAAGGFRGHLKRQIKPNGWVERETIKKLPLPKPTTTKSNKALKAVAQAAIHHIPSDVASVSAKKVYKCHECGRTFTHPPAFTQHKRSHERFARGEGPPVPGPGQVKKSTKPKAPRIFKRDWQVKAVVGTRVQPDGVREWLVEWGPTNAAGPAVVAQAHRDNTWELLWTFVSSTQVTPALIDFELERTGIRNDPEALITFCRNAGVVA